MDLARELQARLDDSGLSLREVAKRMGTSPTQVGRILRLETKISIATLWKFARVLGCTVAVCVSKDVAPATKKDDTVPHELLESICRRLQRIEERMGLQAASGETEFRVVTPSIPAARFTDEEDDASAWKRPN
ncbi:MAG: helix-turn-helix transcriptional regulator [Candidatus Riflebacteria bacterium]|nr:helix-turn-helix transcriptional regulator [Candidatus Riflebacteria bacterium]